jgi:regulator of ribosome biosynthesis
MFCLFIRMRFGTNDWNANDLFLFSHSLDPYEDQYEKRRTEKQEAKQKHQKREKRNKEEGQILSAGRSGKKSNGQKDAIEAALHLTRTSTASIGKFDAKLKNDIKPKGIKRIKEASSVGDVKMEKSMGMKLLDKINKGGNVLNVNKAVKNYEKTERPTRAAPTKGRKGKGRK